MKKRLLFLIMMLFIPLTIFAKEYNEFDIRYDQNLGSNVKDTEIKVYAIVDEETNLKDHTEEFTLEDVKWYKYTSEKEEGKTEEDYDYYDEGLSIYGYLVSDTDVFEKDYKYILYIGRLYAEEEDSFSRNVKINGVDIDELDGTCYNTGNEFFIKTVSNGNTGSLTKRETETIENNLDDSNEAIETNKEVKACMLGNSLCCTTLLGLSICIWIIIAIILIILVIIICACKLKKKGK